MGRSSKQRRSKDVLDRTLEQLDGERWGEPTYDSYVVTTCHALRRKPLRALTDEELRLAVGQGIGLTWLIPLALDRLWNDPLRCVELYEGDLLAHVVRVPATYWTVHLEEKALLVNEIIPLVLNDPRLPDLPKDAQRAVIAFGTLQSDLP